MFNVYDICLLRAFEHIHMEFARYKCLLLLLLLYPGPRGFLLFSIGKLCDANRFLNFFLLPRSAERREKKASGRDRWEPHFHAISF